MTVPVNHHYVPQHFLRAWVKSGSENRLYRFKAIPNKKGIECKKVSIRYSTSQSNLYDIHLPDGNFEVESLIVTPILDEFGHKIISRIRESAFDQLSTEEKKELAVYLVCLEARHPETLNKMNCRDQLADIHETMKSTTSSSHKSIDEVHDYFMASPSIGVISFALFIQNERIGNLDQRFSDGLLRACATEYVFDNNCLITSDFPCFREGDYLSNFLYVVNISPRKALVYSDNSNINYLDKLPVHLMPEVFNFFVLGYAECAFGSNPDFCSFVEQHLGWARRFTTREEKQSYMKIFLMHLFARHGIS